MTKTGKRMGFSAMDPAKVREIASKGGKAAHAHGTAHKFTSEEARVAGKKGGNAPHKSRGKRPKGYPKEGQISVDFNADGSDEDGACADLEALSE